MKTTCYKFYLFYTKENKDPLYLQRRMNAVDAASVIVKKRLQQQVGVPAKVS